MTARPALGTPGGVVGPVDHRLAQAALIALQGPGPLDVRTGVLWAPGAADLVTAAANDPATGRMRVAIAAHHWVTSRGVAGGPYLGTNDGVAYAEVAAAPGTGSRLDVVWVRQADADPTAIAPDPASSPQLGVTAGQASSGTPVKPALPVGAEELATVLVPAQASATTAAGVVITQTARLTTGRGGPVPVRTVAERNALTPYPGLEAVLVAGATAGARFIHDGTTWHQTSPTVLGTYEAPWPDAPGQFGANPQIITAFTIPDPGVPYRVTILAHAEIGTAAVAGASTRWDLLVGYGGSGNALGTITGRTLGIDNALSFQQATGTMSSVLTGALRVGVLAARAFGDKVGQVNGANKRLSATLFAA